MSQIIKPLNSYFCHLTTSGNNKIHSSLSQDIKLDFVPAIIADEVDLVKQVIAQGANVNEEWAGGKIAIHLTTL